MQWAVPDLFARTGDAGLLESLRRASGQNSVFGPPVCQAEEIFGHNPQEQLPGSQRSHTNGPQSRWEAHYTWRRQFTKKSACCPPKVMRALVMSVEMAYNDDVPADSTLEHFRVPADAELQPAATKELGGVMKLTGTLIDSPSAPATGDKLICDEAETALYREARFAESAPILSPGDRRVSVSMIPYYARLNRKSDYFRIWLPVY
jgi:DUF1680 family protein